MSATQSASVCSNLDALRTRSQILSIYTWLRPSNIDTVRCPTASTAWHRHRALHLSRPGRYRTTFLKKLVSHLIVIHLVGSIIKFIISECISLYPLQLFNCMCCVNSSYSSDVLIHLVLVNNFLHFILINTISVWTLIICLALSHTSNVHAGT